jgi:hypothetical protein
VSELITWIEIERIKSEIGKKVRKIQAGFQARCTTIDYIIMHLENNSGTGQRMAMDSLTSERP